ncbi:unnamed protein product [marine sediment metagenome]|uniref:Uncharacterized protein n=1 Tax=marine sediment metagenome TaxID=412755 RepID=X0UNI0_9ZZZZ
MHRFFTIDGFIVKSNRDARLHNVPRRLDKRFNLAAEDLGFGKFNGSRGKNVSVNKTKPPPIKRDLTVCFPHQKIGELRQKLR